MTMGPLPLFGVNLNYNASTSDEGKVVFCKVEGLVGINFITWGTCSVVIANGETKIQSQILEGLPDHPNTVPPHTFIKLVMTIQAHIHFMRCPMFNVIIRLRK